MQMDFTFYQVIVDVLVPDVLSTRISSSLTTQIRSFSKNLEMQLKKAMQGAPDLIQRKKGMAVRMLSQTLRRYTSLNHLAQAARSVLNKEDQITQMFSDFNKVDMTCVQEQAGWVCACDQLMVQHLQSAFRDNLQHQKSLEEWAEWMEAVVDNILAKYHDKPLTTVGEVAKQFLLNWSFYSSMVIRDLTLRSAQSFGSFHLIRLLFDEYMLYLVEQRLAKAANRPTVSIMAQAGQDFCVMEEPIPVPVPHNHQVFAINTHSSLSSQWKVEARPLENADMIYMDGDKSMHYVAPGNQMNERSIVIEDLGEKILEPKSMLM